MNEDKVRESFTEYMKKHQDLHEIYNIIESAIRHTTKSENEEEITFLTLIRVIVELHSIVTKLGISTIHYSEQLEEERRKYQGRIQSYLTSISDN